MANVKVAMSKKGMLIALVIGVLLLGGGGGYLLWRVNQQDTVAPTDSDASEAKWCNRCKPGECVNGKGYSSLANCVETEKDSEKCVGCGDGVRYCGIGVTERYECGISAYHITYKAEPAAGGTVSKAGQNSVSPGGSISSTATPNSGYQFVEWSGGVKTAERTDSNVQADATYTATFEKIPEMPSMTLRGEVVPAGSGDVIKVESSGNIVITNQGVTLKRTDPYTLTAKANSGYKFEKWTKRYTGGAVIPVDKQGTDVTRTGNIDQDITLIANFVKTSSTDPVDCTGFTLSCGSNNTINVNWNLVVAEPQTIKYIARVNKAPKGDWLNKEAGDIWESVESNVNSYVINNVEPGVVYGVNIMAYSGPDGEKDFHPSCNMTGLGQVWDPPIYKEISCTDTTPIGSVCGDGICSADETPATCPADCNGGGGSDTVPDTAIFEDTKDTIIFGIAILMIGVGWTWIVTLPKKAYNSISKASREYVTAVKQSEERNKRESRRNKLERKLK